MHCLQGASASGASLSHSQAAPSKTVHSALDPEVHAALAEAYSEEMELYQYARQLHERQVEHVRSAASRRV